MGIWLKPTVATTVDLAAIAEEMRPALEMWMNAHVRIFDPKLADAGTFDPKLDTVTGGAAPALVYDSGPDGAIVQPIRSPTRVEFAGQSNGVLGIRVQAKRNPAAVSPPVTLERFRAGLHVYVIDGGNAPELAAPGLVYSLLEGVNSTEAWDYIFDATLVTN